MEKLEYTQDPFNRSAARETFAEYIARSVREINEAPADFPAPKAFRIADKLLETLIQKHTENLEDKNGTSLRLLLDIKKTDDSSHFRGDIQSKIVPLLEGLKERGGKINGRKISLQVGEKNFRLTPPAELISRR